MVGYGYVQLFMWEWKLPISGNYFVMGLKDMTTKNWLVSENYWNGLLLIDSIILLQIPPRLQKDLSLVNVMMEIKFLLIVTFIFPVKILVPHREAIFLTSLSTLIHSQPLLWRFILLVLHILLKKGAEKGRKYNSTVRDYCNGRLPSGRICLNQTLLFCSGCTNFNKKA